MTNSLAIFVGPEKTGTTWLYEYCKANPYLQVSETEKELEFFNKQFHKQTDWYFSNFGNSKELTIDVTPTYFTSDIARIRAAKLFPGAKIIVTVRNPLRRVVSHYSHYKKYDYVEAKSFDAELGFNNEYLSSSFYHRHLVSWIQDFGVDNVLVLPIELLDKSPERYLKKLSDFLEVDYWYDLNLLHKKINEAARPRSAIMVKLLAPVHKYLKYQHFGNPLLIRMKAYFKKILFVKDESGETEVSQELQTLLSNAFTKDVQELKRYLDEDIYLEFYANELDMGD